MQLLNLNPILALDRWLSILRYGRGVRFVVPTSSIGPTLAKLHHHGIRTYAYEPPHGKDERAFRVRREQARWARAVLAGKATRAWADDKPSAAARGAGYAGAILGMFQRWTK